MTEQKIDEQLARVSRVIAHTSPEPPDITAGVDGPATKREAFSWGFAVALAVGMGAIAGALMLGSGASQLRRLHEPVESPSARWDWIIDHSEPTADENLRVGDPSATPIVRFDPASLGVEQVLTHTDATTPTYDPTGRGTVVMPWVYVGRVPGTAASGYLFRDVDEVRAETFVCLAILFRGASIGCRDSTPPDGIISGIDGLYADTVPPGDVVVDLWLPPDTALAVLHLDDGRSFIQRPVAGVAIFVLSDLGDARIEYAEALDETGGVIIHQDFLAQWEVLKSQLNLEENSP